MQNVRFLDIEWPVDQEGYCRYTPATAVQRALLELPHEPGVKSTGRKIETYRPLEDYPGLFKRFSELTPTESDVLNFANQFGLLTKMEGIEVFSLWYNEIGKIKRIIDLYDARTSEPIALYTFNEFASARLKLHIDLDSKSKPYPQLQPVNLISAIYVELFYYLTNERKFKKCKNCPTWFTYGPGTGHTTRREFCSDRCKVAFHTRGRNRRSRDRKQEV